MENGTHYVNLRVPVEVHQNLKAMASAQDRSVTWVINKILAEALAKATQGAQQ